MSNRSRTACSGQAGAKPGGDLTTYTWDIENYLTKVELPSNVINTITLDGDGKRRSMEDSAGLRNVIWDMGNILAETNSGNSTVAQYTLAPETYGELVSQRRSGASSFHHFDALGSTNKLSDSGENALVEYLYRAFGQQTVLSGASANPFTWVGKLGYYRQADPSDYWVRARIMKPQVGRWATRDKLYEGYVALVEIKDRIGERPFAYAANRPMSLVDASGLMVICHPSSVRCGWWRYKVKIYQEEGDWYMFPDPPNQRPQGFFPLFREIMCVWYRPVWIVIEGTRSRTCFITVTCYESDPCAPGPRRWIDRHSWKETEDIYKRRRRPFYVSDMHDYTHAEFRSTGWPFPKERCLALLAKGWTKLPD